MVGQPTLPLLFLIFLLGLRHGIDWDHIAAITDIVGASNNKKQAAILGFLYIAGHALVILFLGTVAVFIGIRLPSWIDTVMERVVGLTLILLGIYVLVSISRERENYKIRSRWMMLFSIMRRSSQRIHNKLHRHQKHHDILHHPEEYGKGAAFVLGMIHGVGVETPTQLLLFVSASNVQSAAVGISVVSIFIIGLISANSIVTLVSVWGFMTVKNNSTVYLALGTLTGIFSLVVGISFLFHTVNFLPAIFGG